MFLILVTTLIALLGYKFYMKFIKPHKYWKEHLVPHIKPMFFIGNFYDNLVQRICLAEFLEGIYNKFPNERYFGMYAFMGRLLVIKDPELIKKIGIKDFDYFTDHRVFTSADIDPLWSKNLFARTGEQWRQMRPTLSPSFTSSKMKAMFTLVSDCAEQFVQHFSDTEDVISVDIKDAFTRYTTDVIATCAFGIDCNSLKDRDNDFFINGEDASNFSGFRVLRFAAYSLSPFLAKLFKITIFSAKTSAFFRNITQSTVKLREEQNIVRHDMIHLLMEARKGCLQDDESNKIQETGFATMQESHIGQSKVPTNVEITDDDITAQAMIFFIAGFDTAATLMSYIAYELAVNKDIQERLIQEVDDTFEECNGKLTYEGVHKMKYLDMIVSETLRKWPPTAMLDRICQKEYVIEPERPNESRIVLEKGDTVWFPVYPLQRDEKHYPNPTKFDPERFSDENKGNINPQTYLAFGVGPRNCIGSRFALMENKVIIVHLLKIFEIVPVEKSVIPIKLSSKHSNMTVEGGMWLGFKKRIQ